MLSRRLTWSIIQTLLSRGVSASAGRGGKEKFKREPGKPGSVNKFNYNTIKDSCLNMKPEIGMVVPEDYHCQVKFKDLCEILLTDDTFSPYLSPTRRISQKNATA